MPEKKGPARALGKECRWAGPPRHLAILRRVLENPRNSKDANLQMRHPGGTKAGPWIEMEQDACQRVASSMDQRIELYVEYGDKVSVAMRRGAATRQ